MIGNRLISVFAIVSFSFGHRVQVKLTLQNQTTNLHNLPLNVVSHQEPEEETGDKTTERTKRSGRGAPAVGSGICLFS